MRATTATAAMLLMLTGPGCLSEDGRRIGSDADTTETTETTETTDTTDATDTTDTRGGDTSDDALDSDSLDRCLKVDCDDGDPCTDDRCDPATGECINLGVPGTGAVPISGCVTDGECEDGDPCTANRCVLGCGAGGFCTFELIVGCNDCASGCDDGDPCTRDECRDTDCMHSYQEGCMPFCVSGATTSISDIRTRGGVFPEPLKTTGELFFHELGRSCDDGPNCNCSGSPGLRDGGFDLVLRNADGATPDSESWSCNSSGCMQATEVCGPGQQGFHYRVWGRGLPPWELFAGGSDPMVPAPVIAGIAVQDFCLETAGTSLVGGYDGVVEFAGYTFSFAARITTQDGGLRLINEADSCASCPIGMELRASDVPLVVGDGWVEFDASLPNSTGQRILTVRLYSNRNTLRGTYGGRDGVVPFIALPPGGTMVLTRQ